MMRKRYWFGGAAALSVLILFGGWVMGIARPVDAVAMGTQHMGLELESRMVPTNGITLHVVFAGPVDGPPLVLLHGFPEFWWAWHKVVAPLSAAGYRLIIPDLRGCNASEKPAGVAAYRPEAYERDIVGLIEALGYHQAAVAGHDVGGGVAYRIAIEYPERIRKLVIINSGHPMIETRAITELDEDAVSWYRSFMLLPVLPEFASRFAGWRLMKNNFINTSTAGAFSEEELALYAYAWYRDGAMGTMMHSFRANNRYPREFTGDGTIATPALLLWGVEDTFLPITIAEHSAEYLANGRVQKVADAGHWVLHERPDVIANAMVDFLGSVAVPPSPQDAPGPTPG